MHNLTVTEARARLRDKADEFWDEGKHISAMTLRHVANNISPGDDFQLDGVTWTVED